MYRVFLDYVLPTLIVTSLLGLFLYIFCARLVYDYLREHYHDALPERMSMAFGDAEDTGGGYISAVWYASRTGSYKRIESNTWRKFFVITQSVGAVLVLSVSLLCLSFLFPLKPDRRQNITFAQQQSPTSIATKTAESPVK